MASKLTARTVQTVSRPGYYADGKGLYLQVAEGGARSWIFRFQLAGRRRDMGLGPADTITLAEARERAGAARRLRSDGIDPIEARRQERQEAALTAARGVTFKAAAERYIAAHEASWRNQTHRKQWPSSLQAYVYPLIGDLPVSAIDAALVLKVLEPIWKKKPETAARVRGRIELVLDWATAHGYRIGDNPARWRGHLDKLLPAHGKLRRVKHHAALPYAEIGGVRAGAPRARRRRRPRPGIYDPDVLPNQRGNWRDLGRDRSGPQGLDDPRRKNEGGPRTSGGAFRSRRRNP